MWVGVCVCYTFNYSFTDQIFPNDVLFIPVQPVRSPQWDPNMLGHNATGPFSRCQSVPCVWGQSVYPEHPCTQQGVRSVCGRLDKIVRLGTFCRPHGKNDVQREVRWLKLTGGGMCKCEKESTCDSGVMYWGLFFLIFKVIWVQRGWTQWQPLTVSSSDALCCNNYEHTHIQCKYLKNEPMRLFSLFDAR